MLFQCFGSLFCILAQKELKYHWFYKHFRQQQTGSEKPSVGNAFSCFLKVSKSQNAQSPKMEKEDRRKKKEERRKKKEERSLLSSFFFLLLRDRADFEFPASKNIKKAWVLQCFSTCGITMCQTLIKPVENEDLLGPFPKKAPKFYQKPVATQRFRDAFPRRRKAL